MATISQANLPAFRLTLEPSWLTQRHHLFGILEIIADSREDTRIGRSVVRLDEANTW